jgi:hypothetical protein
MNLGSKKMPAITKSKVGIEFGHRLMPQVRWSSVAKREQKIGVIRRKRKRR